MNKEAIKELVENELIKMMAEQFGISGDKEAGEILRGVVFNPECLEGDGG